MRDFINIVESTAAFKVGDHVDVKKVGKGLPWLPAVIVTIEPTRFRIRWDHDGGEVWYSNWANVRPLSTERQSVQSICEEVAEKIKNPFNQCKSVCMTLVKRLRSAGYKAEVLQCSGLKTPAPDADPRWLKLGAGKQIYWMHYVVKCDGKVYDLTRRQFFPKTPAVFVQPSRAFKGEWSSIYPTDL